MSRSTYYYTIKSFNAKDKYASLKEEILEIYNKHNGNYGYRRITDELNKTRKINHKTVYKIMQQLGIQGKKKLKKYSSYQGHVGETADNILDRNFEATNPNEKWTTDVTQFKVRNEKLYLSPILDLFNGEIISYNISISPNFAQTMDMLDKAFAKIPDNTNLIFHSDQGWQYQMKPYVQRLKDKGIIQSMSRKGNCLDNSVMENFFGILKREMYNDVTFESIEELTVAIEDYIYYYNNLRIKNKLGGMSPVEYRLHSTQAA